MISLRPIDGLLTSLLGSALLSIVLVTTAGAGECVDTSEYAHWIAGVPTVGDAIGVDVVDGIAYVADGNSGLTLIDVSDPTAPAFITNHFIPGRAYEVQVVGSFAYVACGFEGLATVDVSDPGALETTSVRPTDGSARALDIVDGLLVLAISRITPGGWLETYDLGIPTFPIRRGQVATPRRVNDVQLRDGIAYLTATYCDETGCTGGVGTFDVSDPTFPFKIGWRGGGPATGIALDGDLAYVSSEVWGVQILDVSDPSFIQLVRGEGGFEGHDVTFRDEVLLVAADELVLVDALDPGDPLLVGTVSAPPDGPADASTRVHLAGDLAYVTGSGRLNVVRVTIPDLVGAEETLPAVSEMTSLVRVRDDLVVAIDGDALITVEVGADLIAERGRVALGGLPSDVAATDGAALVAAGPDGVIPVDLADPDLPLVSGALALGRSAHAIAASGPLGLVGAAGNEDGALLVLDLTDALAPEVVGELHLPDAVDAVVVRPVAGPPVATSARVAGASAAVILSGGSVLSISLEDASDPTVTGSFDPPGTPHALAATARHAFVVGTGGVTVIDLIADEIVTTAELPGVASSIVLDGDRALVGMGDDGVAVLDLRDPRTPTPDGLLDADGVTDVALDPTWSLATIGPAGLARFPGPCGVVSVAGVDAHPAALRPTVRPNPFRTATVVEFDLVAPGRVTGAVFDPSGREIRALLPATRLDEGPHRLSWDGTTDDGRTVSAGVYFIRVRTAGRTLTTSVVRTD